jgi:hypothetical protein
MIHRDAAPERVTEGLGWYCSECGAC